MPPPYSKSKIDRVGRAFADNAEAVLADLGRLGDPAVQTAMTEGFEVIGWWRGEHAKPLSRVAANLRHHVRKESDPIVAQRLKRAATIGDKLVRERTMKLSRMADIGGVRAIVPDQAAAYRVANRLRRNWTITKFRDYVAEPKEDGYHALHLINRNRGRLIEIQLRTPLQDEWANLVEKLSRLAFPGLKFGAGPPELRGLMIEWAGLIAKVDQKERMSAHDMERLLRLGPEVANLIRDPR
jgi:putative GTP pyrophosphokinase